MYKDLIVQKLKIYLSELLKELACEVQFRTIVLCLSQHTRDLFIYSDYKDIRSIANVA